MPISRSRNAARKILLLTNLHPSPTTSLLSRNHLLPPLHFPFQIRKPCIDELLGIALRHFGWAYPAMVATAAGVSGEEGFFAEGPVGEFVFVGEG